MDVTLHLDDQLGEADLATLRKVLQCTDNGQLAQALVGIGKAAVSEYLDMLLGKHMPTKANEIWERRLLHLLKHYFRGQLPPESVISSMFQQTESGSSTLLRHVRSKFRVELEQELLNTIQTTLVSARFVGEKYSVVIQSDNILEELKRTVSIQGPGLNQIAKVKNAACLYTIPEDTFDLLCTLYGVDLAAMEAAPE